MPSTSPHSLAILGAGPVGLEAAALALELGFDVHVFERATPGAHVSAWGHVRMFTPWRMNLGPASARLLARHGWSAPAADEHPTGHEFADRVLLPLAGTSELKPRVHAHQQVVAVSRHGAFTQIYDLHEASGVSTASLRRLAAADAFTSMGLDRQQATWQILALRDRERILSRLVEERTQALVQKNLELERVADTVREQSHAFEAQARTDALRQLLIGLGIAPAKVSVDLPFEYGPPLVEDVPDALSLTLQGWFG